MHIRTRYLSTVLHILLFASLASCRHGETAARPRPGPGAFKVALLTPGPISDHGWNAGAYEGLLRIRDSLGASISHIQTKTPADFEENFRQYGAQHYNLVFGHGFEFQDAASRVGPSFPQTVYITTSGNRVGPNVAPIVFGFEDPSYSAGVLAALMTRTGTIGVIGGTELPPVRSSFLAFTAGAKSVNPRIAVLSSYIGSWEDASAGREQALAQIHRRADMIFQNADAAGLGVFQAARQARGVYVFGANADQNSVAPDVIIGSVVIDLPLAFLTVARDVKNHQFRSGVIHLGAASGVVKLVLNPAMSATIPKAVLAKVDSVESGIAHGSIAPPKIEFVDTAGTR